MQSSVEREGVGYRVEKRITMLNALLVSDVFQKDSSSSSCHHISSELEPFTVLLMIFSGQ